MYLVHLIKNYINEVDSTSKEDENVVLRTMAWKNIEQNFNANLLGRPPIFQDRGVQY